MEQHRRGGDPPGTLVLSQQEGYVGDSILLRGRNLPAEESFEVTWRSSKGRWGILQANEIVGPQYQPRTDTIATVETDESGAFDESWTVQEDYGGAHTVELRTTDGEPVDQAEFEIVPSFELDRTTAPLGEAFPLTGYGIGPGHLTNNYQVTWDNGDMGFMTGVMNRGTATAEIRAVGPPGGHVIQVWRNYRGVPFLQNNTQSPYGPVAGGRQTTWTVEVTEPEEPPETAWMDPQLEEGPISTHYPEIDDPESGASLEISPTSGPAGTTAFIEGEGFPPEEEVVLTWYRHTGHRVKGIPITPEPKPDVLPNVETDADGRFQVEFEIPRDVGSTRPITAAVGGKEVAVTGFMMQPSIASFGPTEGPVGTEIEIELAGVGWTIYENAAYFVYDNQQVGYVCGVDDEDADGISRTILRAAGEPGWHFIDVYPSLFEMQEDEPNFILKPHLSYLDNHPIRPLPAFHFAFKVTE